MGSCVARQPIFTKKLNIYGYELLYRSAASSSSFSNDNEDQASSETIINSFHQTGIENVTGGKRAFVNFTQKLLLDGVATILPSRILVVELLENIRPSDIVLDACRKLRERGYQIALDDFVLEPEFFPLLQVADIVKIDFLESPMNQIERFAYALSKTPTILLAEKVETQEIFDKASDMGFSLFQGYFFAKPVIVTGAKAITPLKTSCMQLIRLALSPNINFSRISDIIKHDVALSYRLLRVVNSAFFGLRYTVKNIRQALAILGMDEVKKWITLISLAEIKDDKPDELIRISLIRAKMMEVIGPVANINKLDDLFLIGLMSLMDAIMDMEMQEIVAQTSLSPNIAGPLMTGEGSYGDLLSLVIHYEKSEWDEALALAEQYGIPDDVLSKAYIEAIEWSRNI